MSQIYFQVIRKILPWSFINFIKTLNDGWVSFNIVPFKLEIGCLWILPVLTDFVVYKSAESWS